jgi:hypothetical protein
LKASTKSISTVQEITVIDIRPGFVKTKKLNGDKIFWVSPVDKACNQIIVGIQNKQSIVYVTRRWRLIAWMLKLLPAWCITGCNQQRSIEDGQTFP